MAMKFSLTLDSELQDICSSVFGQVFAFKGINRRAVVRNVGQKSHLCIVVAVIALPAVGGWDDVSGNFRSSYA